MTTYARIINGMAHDVVIAPVTIDGHTFQLEDMFAESVANDFTACPDDVVAGSTLNPDGTWIIFIPPAPPTVAPDSLPLLTPMTLYMAFTPVERIAIKASTDPMVVEFWAMYQLSVQLEKPTDPNLVSVQEALAYLAQPKDATPPGAGILASKYRIAQILAGIPQ